MAREDYITWRNRVSIHYENRTDIVWYPVLSTPSVIDLAYMYLSSLTPFDVDFSASVFGRGDLSSKTPFDIKFKSDK